MRHAFGGRGARDQPPDSAPAGVGARHADECFWADGRADILGKRLKRRGSAGMLDWAAGERVEAERDSAKGLRTTDLSGDGCVSDGVDLEPGFQALRPESLSQQRELQG